MSAARGRPQGALAGRETPLLRRPREHGERGRALQLHHGEGRRHRAQRRLQRAAPVLRAATEELWPRHHLPHLVERRDERGVGVPPDLTAPLLVSGALCRIRLVGSSPVGGVGLRRHRIRLTRCPY